MNRRLFVLLVAALAALLCSTSVVPVSHAGGWAVTSLDPLPTISPGEPAAIEFTILQHGRTPVMAGEVTIDIRGDGGELLTFAAEPGVAEGRYTATVTFPESGEFSWTVNQGWFGPQELGTVRVVDGSSATTADAGRSSTWRAGIRYSLGTASIGLITLGALEHFRSRRRLVAA